MGHLASLASGLEYYVVGSTSDKPLLLIADVFGYNSGRTRTIADQFASQGYYVIVPKLLTPGLDGGTDGVWVAIILISYCIINENSMNARIDIVIV